MQTFAVVLIVALLGCAGYVIHRRRRAFFREWNNGICADCDTRWSYYSESEYVQHWRCQCKQEHWMPDTGLVTVDEIEPDTRDEFRAQLVKNVRSESVCVGVAHKARQIVAMLPTGQLDLTMRIEAVRVVFRNDDCDTCRKLEILSNMDYVYTAEGPDEVVDAVLLHADDLPLYVSKLLFQDRVAVKSASN